MFTTTGTDSRILIVIRAVLSAAVARWHATGERAWSFAIYYLGYRALSVQLSCGSVAVSGVPLVLKYAAG